MVIALDRCHQSKEREGEERQRQRTCNGRRSLSICSRSATWLGAASERRARVAADTCVRRSKAGGCAGGGGLVGKGRRLNHLFRVLGDGV